MVRKALRMLVPAGVTLLVASQWADIKRYLRIKQLSARQGHPEHVPARGRAAYPQAPGRGATDGTGDFYSASRGGPAPASDAGVGPGRHRGPSRQPSPGRLTWGLPGLWRRGD